MADDGAKVLRMTEPKVVDCHFVEGITVEVRDEFVRLTGWIDLETTPGEAMERRIVVRAAVPTLVVRALIRDLRRGVARGGN